MHHLLNLLRTALLLAPASACLAAADPQTPDQERASFTVPEGYTVELVASESEGIGKFVPLAFDAQGRLWTTTAFEYPVDGNENPAAADALYASRAKDKVLVFDTPFAPGPQTPRVFADGLAIPLGVLPYGDGCYVQHGHDIVLLHDRDGDGKADEREVILTGFGVQDSHLFPHQFMRAPGGWIWMAQGAFNYSKVQRPGEPAEKAVQFDQTRMAKFRPDGSEFTITSNGPCNIWGLVLNGEGEAFIQEANDFGYPVMPFHEYANYPGCSNAQWKSYAPEFPATADFRMGGTGLSGLALTDKDGPFTEPWRDVMLVANPITNRINAIKMHRDGPRWRLEKLPDFLTSTDSWFRPVAITVGPDGCLYIVDWYNKIISHNEVPRNHPDRDKTRGRIWRVKPTGSAPFVVPDFTKLSGEELLAKLGGPSLAQSHLAWQTIGDRKMVELAPRLRQMVMGKPVVAPAGEPQGSRVGWASSPPRDASSVAPPNVDGRDLTTSSPSVPGRIPGTAGGTPTLPEAGRSEQGSRVGRVSYPPSDVSNVAHPDNAGHDLAHSSPGVPGRIPGTAGGTPALPEATRIAALWALRALGDDTVSHLGVQLATTGENRNLRREGVLAITKDQWDTAGGGRQEKIADQRLGETDDAYIDRVLAQRDAHAKWLKNFVATLRQDDLEVASAAITQIGDSPSLLFSVPGDGTPIGSEEWLGLLLSFVDAPLPAPLAASTQSGRQIKAGVAYDGEFRRYLVRGILERDVFYYPTILKKLLESTKSDAVSVEGRLLAALSLHEAGAKYLPDLLVRLSRPPGQEEILRLAQFPKEPGVAEALRHLLTEPATSQPTLEALIASRTRLTVEGELRTLLAETARGLIRQTEGTATAQGVRLASAFQLIEAEPALVDFIEGTVAQNEGPGLRLDPTALDALRALRALQGGPTPLLERLAREGAPIEVRAEAVSALAISRHPDAPARLLALYPNLPREQQRDALTALAGNKDGGKALVAALRTSALPREALDAATADRLQAVLGDDADLAALLQTLGVLSRPVLALDGSEEAWTQTDITIEGPCTLEAWVKLEPQGRSISNADGIGGAPDQLDLNFAGGKFRVYTFAGGDMAIAKKLLMPGLWTHVAATRNEEGIWKLYLDGELEATATRPAPGRIENFRIGWTTAKGGTRGVLSEFRYWDHEIPVQGIQGRSNRAFPVWQPDPRAKGGIGNTGTIGWDNHFLRFVGAGSTWGQLRAGARVRQTSDYPPVLTSDEATALDARYTKYRALAWQPGDAVKGRQVALLCQSCHLMGNTGGNIGPDLSGVGAMGVEAILRNILEPNAAMENGYRIYRVELKNGDLVDALFVREDKEAVVIRQPGAEDRRIPKSEIRTSRYLRRSLMPEGLLEGMTDEAVRDLFAYLKTLR